MAGMIFHYPVWIRIWHWLNAIFCLLLIVSGISMQYSDPDSPFIGFEVAMRMHNVCGVLLSINYILFFIRNIFSENKRHYTLRKDIWHRLARQFKYYTYGVFKGQNPPFPITTERKFNPLQKFTYILIMYVGMPIIVITGWALLFPEMIVNQIFGVSGVLLTDLLHIIIGFIISIFLIVHVYFCTMGTKVGSLFRGMITGWVEPH